MEINFLDFNSEKYGFILDLVISARYGFMDLKKQKIDLPYQIKGAESLVRHLSEMLEDCGLTEILPVGTRLQIVANDITSYRYAGKPFSDDSEVKTVDVVSPGWLYGNTIISLPKVKEVLE